MIIIVDDESRFSEALQSLLKAANFTSTVFSSAEEALKSGVLAEATCVITDMCMTGMQGLELHSHIKRDYPMLPVIMISGHRSEQTRLRALSQGASAFLYKPLDPDDLFHALSLALSDSEKNT